MKPNKNETRNVALKRIDYLYNLMNSESVVPKSEIVKQIEKLSVRFDITLSKNIKRSYCKNCKYPYEHNCRLRIKKGKVLVTCLNCNNIRRFDISH
ncbi:MAG: hypothetical protein B2I18_04945 [Cuniculiplasma sp. C_DKE]|nr:MAG: hypothetical protein B2I18_04945 [Cuniculiplasma sp. C_DKE]